MFLPGHRGGNPDALSRANAHLHSLYYCFSQNVGILGSANNNLSGGLSPVNTIILITPPLLPSLLMAKAKAAQLARLHTDTELRRERTILNKLNPFFPRHFLSKVGITIPIDIS